MAGSAFFLIDRFATLGLLFRVNTVPYGTWCRSRFLRTRDAKTSHRTEENCDAPMTNKIHSDSEGSVYAIYSPEYGPPLTATTMYCLPLYMYVIGDPDCGAGMNTAPTSLPDFLS